ncbi:MAG TPA: glycosyltransferase [Vitreimonas sp.]|uniref:CgeB family protein n=1 Tax=Vitreimonas sp. TaxID=3069702 RepID=UPI002D3AE530|nr:glycosyltransferase [Vitreimonas sp.]HYD88105.1 glycosyltransferase [Vitreimonas sp.]
MKIVYFTHSLRSCWNHGNAHFLRGVLRELIAQGHHTIAYEPENGWSPSNLVADHGAEALNAWRFAYPELVVHRYSAGFDAAAACEDADLVIVHEWNESELIATLGRARGAGAGHLLLFHDTHHRAVSEPASMRGYDLRDYDGVLAFGESLAEVYRRDGWGRRVFVWHEAADTRRFKPPAEETEREGLVWIGNWGDGERTAELEAFLLRPAQQAGLPLDIHGVRYPAEATALLERYGARYRGWLANAKAPEVFSRHLATVHVPRRFYVEQLPGIPTIRVFEALACGIPLVTSPWRDGENLFRPGRDFLTADNPESMLELLALLRSDPACREELSRNGLETIRSRHTCAHRAEELLRIVAALRGAAAPASPVESQREATL